VSVAGLPLESRAGVNFARLWSNLHAVLSRMDEPLDDVTWQSVTRPSVPMLSLKPVVPLCPARIAESG
jgi:hypothetical protein